MHLRCLAPLLLALAACAPAPCADGYGRDGAGNCVALAGDSSDGSSSAEAPDDETPAETTDEDTGGEGEEIDTGAAGEESADDTGAISDDTDEGVDTSASGDTGWGDLWEGWPQTTFFPTYCGWCHPTEMSSGLDNDWTVYSNVMVEYNHIYCGVGLEMVPECGDHHEPGHLPQEGGPQPTDDERRRLIAWMDAGMPRE